MYSAHVNQNGGYYYGLVRKISVFDPNKQEFL